MKKITLTIGTLVFSIMLYAQSDGKSGAAEVDSPATRLHPRSASPDQPSQPTKNVTPQSNPEPRQLAPAPLKPVKLEKNKPLSSPPPVKPAPMLGSPKPAEGNDNGQHKDQGKHKGEIKHDHEKNDHEHKKDSIKVKKKED